MAGRRCAGWVAKMLPPTSGGAHESFDRTGAESGPIPRVSVRRSLFAILLTMLDVAPAIESENPQPSASGRKHLDVSDRLRLNAYHEQNGIAERSDNMSAANYGHLKHCASYKAVNSGARRAR